VPFRRTLLTLLVVLAVSALSAGRAEALNIRDIIELSKAGLSDQVLIALIEVDRGVFSVDTDTLKKLKNEGVSDPVIVAMIRSGRMPAPAVEPAAAPVQNTDPASPDETSREPQVIVIDHHDQSPAAPQVMYPVGYVVPGLYPGYARPGFVSTNSGAGITGFGNTGFNNPAVNSGFNCYGSNIGFNGFGNNVVVATPRRNNQSVTTVVPTDQGLVKARVPVPVNCVAAQPVFWGFGGKLRPGSWQPPPTVLCR
jgi:hypothetical protein